MEQFGCININPIYFSIINIFISTAIIFDISNKEYKRLLLLFILKYILTLILNHITQVCLLDNEYNEKLSKCMNIFFYVSLWVIIGIIKKYNYVYYGTTFPIVFCAFYSNITENKSDIILSNYSLIVYYFIWCIVTNKVELTYFKG